MGAAAGGGVAVEAAGGLTFRPLLTRRETALEQADRSERKHWLWPGECWCGLRHQSDEGPTLIAPPWHPSRDGESALAVGVAW